MPHFVTSRQNEDHVTSANAAHLTAGLLGNGCYVLPVGQKLACTMTDSNTLRVLFGVGSVCGYASGRSRATTRRWTSTTGCPGTTASTCSWRASRRRLQKRWS